MTAGRTRRTAPTLALAVALLALAAAPVDASPTRAPGRGLMLIQYLPTGAAPLPWSARLLSSSPQLTTASGPRAAADAEGGVQVAFRNASGDAVWLDGSGTGHFRAVDLSSLTDEGDLQGAPVPALGAAGDAQVYAITTAGRLVEFDQALSPRFDHVGLPGHSSQWTVFDLTSDGGPLVAGSPSVVVHGATTAVFARTRSGHLVEYVNQPLRGRPWRAYDVSAMAAGPTIASDPAAFYDPAAGAIRVAAAALAPVPGDLVVFSPTDVGGRLWAFQDVTAATSTSPLSGGVAAAVEGASPLLFAPGSSGDLLEFTGTDAGTATTWSSADWTSTTQGAPEVSGTPAVAVAGTHVAVAAAAQGWGDLFEWDQPTSGAPVAVTDVSITGQGPARTVAGTPAITILAGEALLFGAGVSVPAPEGSGVYAIPSDRWSQAIKDGWPILGVTGGLGTQCAPWVGYVTPPGPGIVEPDQYVGATIQQSHVRETWLSFWTISGPGTQAGSGCTQEKPPFTSATFFAHGYAAGQWVATQIDAYRAAGLALKPDWVIFDPEGYPDDHSGLWGPTSPASALHKSVADWFGMLRGWKAGLDAVDPSLKAAVYANQYEYMTYELYDQPLPTFIAGAFSEQTVGGKPTLVPPTRSAFGANILGFVMFNENFTPTCAQLDNEALLLTAAPWNGDYNTVQTTASSYCAPGTAAARLRELRAR